MTVMSLFDEQRASPISDRRTPKREAGRTGRGLWRRPRTPAWAEGRARGAPVGDGAAALGMVGNSPLRRLFRWKFRANRPSAGGPHGASLIPHAGRIVER